MLYPVCGGLRFGANEGGQMKVGANEGTSYRIVSNRIALHALDEIRMH